MKIQKILKFIKTSVKIEEIKISTYPIVIITDVHCQFRKIDRIKELYPNSNIICLGDITDLFNKRDDSNRLSIQYFIDNKIPCLRGNHEEHIIQCANAHNGDSLQDWKVLVLTNEQGIPLDEYKLDEKQEKYLKELPMGFKLTLPDGYNFLCFHNRPRDLWTFTESTFIEDEFLKTYPVTSKTKSVIIGHNHKQFVNKYTNYNLISVGAFRDNYYALITENGVGFKKLTI